MAAYINSRRWVNDPERKEGQGEIVDYYIDSAADLEKLPDAAQIKETSTAFDISTGSVYVLTESGWRLMI